MRYEIEIPPEIERRLIELANASGLSVEQLIQLAVVKYVESLERQHNSDHQPGDSVPHLSQ